ncbi:MAG: endonuclease/exonuclease/phosphatase family protein [Chitinophagales bacterium]|nr:endonuclease/exonuclease/phosphatase family protein [Chitinophagales bacterium]
MNFLHGLLSIFSRSANLVAFILIIASGAAGRINPDIFWPLGLLGLAYPFFALINIFFIISWILRKRFFFIFSLIGLLFTFPQLKAQIALPIFQKKLLNEKPSLRVMSYNIRNFDLYNWSKNLQSRQSMVDTIQRYQPDVLFLQEYYSDKDKYQNKELLNSLGYKYSQFALELTKKKNRVWGVAIFSKYPISESGEFVRQGVPSPYGNFHNRGVFADIQIENQKIRFISVHLQSIYLGIDDYGVIKELKEDPSYQMNKYMPILRKLGKAYKQRGVQTAELRTFIESSPYPVILGGDFNDTPGSFAYQQMSEILDDTFIKKGKGIGATYNGIIPFLRIDYIFIDKEMDCTQFIKNKNSNSDHFPIIADITLPKK